MRTSLLAASLLFAAGCGPESEGNELELNVKWAFLSGDCTSNNVTRVKATWGATGATTQDVEFDCSAGQGKLGQFGAMGGEYGITAVGLDSGGIARFTHFGSTITVGSRGTLGEPVDLTLRPNPSDVIVTWRMSSGGGCPGSVVLPYTITIFNPPAMMGGTPTVKVKETQESCSTRTATLQNVAPGSYVVDLDSRAVTPMVKAQKNVTVLGGENAMVDFQL